MIINIATKVPIRMVETIGIHDNMNADKIIAIETKIVDVTSVGIVETCPVARYSE